MKEPCLPAVDSDPTEEYHRPRKPSAPVVGNVETTDGRTSGFTLSKGLISGFTRYPNPSSMILVYFPFLDVRESMQCLLSTRRSTLPCTDGYGGRGPALEGGVLPAPSSPNMGTLWVRLTAAMPHRAN